MSRKQDPKDKLYITILEAGEIMGSYRDLADTLDIPHQTLHRVAKELEEENKIQIRTEDSLTFFEIIGTPKKVEEKKQMSIFDFPIGTDKFEFTSRQHRLIDFLKNELIVDPDRYVGKMEVLYELRGLYFVSKDLSKYYEESITPGSENYTTELNKYYNEVLGAKRYSMKEYADLTKDVQVINEHLDIRQVLIISRSGANGGIKIAKKSEAFESLKSEFIHILKKLKRTHLKRKFLENDGQYRLVIKEEKEMMEILK